MQFRIEHVFRNITLEQYGKLYFDEDFNIAMCEDVKLARRVVERDVTPERVHRVLVVGPDREIPAPAAKVLGSNRIEYTEHLDFDFGTYTGQWKTVSSLMTEKVDARGSLRFSDAGGGVRRVVEGDIKVKIFGVGTMVEKFVVADIEKSYERAAAFTQKWIDGGKVGPFTQPWIDGGKLG